MFIIDIGLMEAHARFHTCLVNNIFGDLYSVQHFHIKRLEKKTINIQYTFTIIAITFHSVHNANHYRKDITFVSKERSR